MWRFERCVCLPGREESDLKKDAIEQHCGKCRIQGFWFLGDHICGSAFINHWSVPFTRD